MWISGAEVFLLNVCVVVCFSLVGQISLCSLSAGGRQMEIFDL